nr:hypothetical protein [uncultured Rhodopila sp.]
MSQGAWFVFAGAVITVIGFAKSAEPVVELGVSLVVVGWITIPKPKA